RFGARIPRGAGRLNLDPRTPPPQAVGGGRRQVAAPPKAPTRRYPELCLPAGPESAAAAAASGADVWVADLEDSMSPTWENLLAGQAAMAHYARRYVRERPTMIMRPRGLHLHEPRIEVDGEPVAAALVDTVIFFHHCARTLVDLCVVPHLCHPNLDTPDHARWRNQLRTHW